jgi:hypothetical protein
VLTDLAVLGTSTCTCGCADPIGAICVGTGVLWYWGESSTCSGTSSFIYITAACTSMSAVYGDRYWSFDTSGLTVAGGSCAVNSVADVPPLELETRLIACGGATDAGGCTGGDVCLPRTDAPFGEELCVWRAGDVLCPPSSSYNARTLYYTTFADTRGCATCTCGSPAGSCAGSSLTLISNGSCFGYEVLAELPGDGTCTVTESTPMTQGVIYNQVVDAACAPSTGAPTGTVTPGDPITVCCLTP